MKKIILVFTLCLAIGTIITLNSCKKAAGTSNNDSTSAADASNTSSAMNATNDDATNAASTNSSMSGKTAGFELLCGAMSTVDSVNGVITITYSGAECSGIIKRMGTVSVTLLNYAQGARWKNAGATLKIAYSNLVVTNILSGASYTFNGANYITNVTGGLAYQVMNGTVAGTVVHKHVADNLTMTFANGQQRTWSVRRTRTFTGSGPLSVRTITLTGDTMINGQNNVEIWGTNNNGDAFTSSLIAPIVTGGIYSGEGVSSNVFHPSTVPPGKYAITYTLTDSGCSSSAVDTITVNYCTGINGIGGIMNVDVYPNPSNGNFELVITNGFVSDFNIDVIDVDGRKIMEAMHESATAQYVKVFDLTALSKGVYFVRVITNNEMIVKRVVLQ